jgi:hypothetical protein
MPQPEARPGEQTCGQCRCSTTPIASPKMAGLGFICCEHKPQWVFAGLSMRCNLEGKFRPRGPAQKW